MLSYIFFNVHPYLKNMIQFDSYFSGSNHQLENPDSQNQQFRGNLQVAFGPWVLGVLAAQRVVVL